MTRALSQICEFYSDVGGEFDEVKLKVPAPSPATQGFRGRRDWDYNVHHVRS
jgi:hypothetical protein